VLSSGKSFLFSQLNVSESGSDCCSFHLPLVVHDADERLFSHNGG